MTHPPRALFGSAFLALGLAVAATYVTAARQQTTPPPPPTQQPASQTSGQVLTFKSGVDLVVVDTQVVDRDGKPITTLVNKDFEVWINGKPRTVVSADLVQYPLSTPRDIAPPPLDPSVTVRRDLPDIRGRVFVVVVDEMSFTPMALPQAMQTVKRFLDSLPAEDVVGLFAYPIGPARLDLTHYHNQTGLALNKLQGLKVQEQSEFGLTPSEVMDITARDGRVTQDVINRECYVSSRGGCVLVDGSCPSRVQHSAEQLSTQMQAQSEQSFTGLRELLQDLSALNGPKTVVLVSAGMINSDRIGRGVDVSDVVQAAGKFAAAADASLYVMHVDNGFMDSMSVIQKPGCQGNTASFQGSSQMRDSELMANGLERVAGEAGGAYFRMTNGTGDQFFKRVLSETSSYYLLGVQPEAADRDGRTHFIRVKADAKNATVRARTQVTIPKG